MAANPKRTVDYFPHFVHQSRELEMLKRNWGEEKGYTYYYKTFELLGDSENHQLDLTNKKQLQIYSFYLNINIDTMNKWFDDLSDYDIIDSKLYEKGIVWSDVFFSGVEELYKRRKIKAEKPGTENDIQDVCNNPFEEDNCMQYVDNNGINVYNNGINVYNNPQRKGKETKRKESKSNQKKGKESDFTFESKESKDYWNYIIKYYPSDRIDNFDKCYDIWIQYPLDKQKEIKRFCKRQTEHWEFSKQNHKYIPYLSNYLTSKYYDPGIADSIRKYDYERKK